MRACVLQVHAFPRVPRWPSDTSLPDANLKGPGDYAGESRGRMGRAATVQGRWRTDLASSDKRTGPGIGPGAYNPQLPIAGYSEIGHDNRSALWLGLASIRRPLSAPARALGDCLVRDACVCVCDV